MRDTTLHEFRRCIRDIDEKSILSANLKYSICCFGRIFDFHPVDETDHGSQKRKKKGGGQELTNIQSLSSRRFVHGDTWLCKYFHFKHCQGQRSSFTSRIIGCTPGDVYRIPKYVGERATSIPRSNFTRTRYAATWPHVVPGGPGIPYFIRSLTNF